MLAFFDLYIRSIDCWVVCATEAFAPSICQCYNHDSLLRPAGGSRYLCDLPAPVMSTFLLGWGLIHKTLHHHEQLQALDQEYLADAKNEKSGHFAFEDTKCYMGSTV